MKIVVNIILLITIWALKLSMAHCQDTNHFEYEIPVKKSEISEADYNKAIFIIENTEQDIKSKGNINYIHFLNYATASILLDEPEFKIESLFDSAFSLNQGGMKSIFPKLFPYKKLKLIYSLEEYGDLLNRYGINSAEEQDFKCSNSDLSQINVNNNNIDDNDLVKLIRTIEFNDQKYRGENKDWDIQSKLDVDNMNLIDSLFLKYNKYIGTSLVGDKYNHVMWLVIQHADLKNQEKYLPIIANAVEDGEIPETPLKMLLDRIYTQKSGFQIYGSQFDIPLGHNDTINKVQEKYNLY